MLASIFWKYSFNPCIYLILPLIIPLVRSIYFVKLIYFCLWILISSSKFLKVARDLSRFSIFLFWLSFSEFSPLTALFNLSIYWMKFPFCCVSWASSLSKSPIFLVWSYKIFMLFFNPSMVLTWLFSSLSKSFFSFSIII